MANNYFRYKDGRDQGYLWGPAFSYLGGVLYDLGCHCSCMPKAEATERPEGASLGM